MSDKYQLRCGRTGCTNPVEERCQYCDIPLCGAHMRILKSPDREEFYCGPCFAYMGVSGLDRRDLDRRLIPNILVVNSKKCTGCRSCELACSFAHFKEFSYELSAIRVIKEEERARNYPILCRQCENPPCAAACPTEALVKNEENGWVMFKEENCNQCEKCLEACPYEAIFFNAARNTIIKCDLCGGDPACAKICSPEALEWIKKYKVGERKTLVLDMNPYLKKEK
jgi:anaerobic carbon-monoxide dehydrogenase iron sulfur subunit